MAKAFLPLNLLGPPANSDLDVQPDSGYWTIFEAAGIRPYSDYPYAGSCGTATYRWNLVRAYTITSGDIGFEETSCLKCGKNFEVGEDIILKVKALSEWGGTLMIPIHLECASTQKVKRKVIMPKFEYKHVFANGKRILEQCPVRMKKLVKTLQVKKVEGYEIARLDEKIGKWKRVRIGQQIPDFIIGEEMIEAQALEEVEIEKEEIIYEETEIEI